MDIKKIYIDLCDDRAKIAEKQEKIEELLTVATNTTMPLGEEKTYTIGGSKDRIGTVMDKVMDLEKEIAILRTKYHDKQAVLVLNLSKISNVSRKQVAIDHFIRMKSLTQIASKANITQRGVCKSLSTTRAELLCINPLQKAR